MTGQRSELVLLFVKLKFATILATSAVHLVSVWSAVGVLKASGFVPFNFFGPPTHDSPWQTFLFIFVGVSSYPMAWIADSLSIPINWFTVTFGSVVNSVIWGVVIGLIIHAFRRKRHLTMLPLLLAMASLSGCAYVLPLATRPTDVKLRVQTSHPENHIIRVTAFEPPSDYPINSDGTVSFTVPQFRRGCSIYVLGAIKVADGRPERLRVVEVRNEKRALRRLSLNQLAKLPEDANGYRTIKLRD